MNKKIFIGGSRIGIIQNTLPDDTKRIIDNIINKNYEILIGDADGADIAVQEYLAQHDYKNVTIYYSGEQIRNIANDSWNTKHIAVNESVDKSKRSIQAVKDKEMAKQADAGFMIWSDVYINKRFGNKCVSSGTLTNIYNLLCINKPVVVYYIPNKTIYSFNSLEDFENKLYPIIDKITQNKWQSIARKNEANKTIPKLFD